MASYETYLPQDTASTTAVVDVAVAICLKSLMTDVSTTCAVVDIVRFIFRIYLK